MYMVDLTKWVDGKKLFVNSANVVACSVREEVIIDCIVKNDFDDINKTHYKKGQKARVEERQLNSVWLDPEMGLDGKPKKTIKWYADIMLVNGLVLSKQVDSQDDGTLKLKETLDFNC